MGAELLVRQAVPDDLDTAVQVITEVSAWLAGKDISWLIDFPGPFKERIAQGEVYLAYLDDWKTLTGTVSLSREPDPELWSSYPGQARYVHRLAVRRKFAGQGIGAALLDLAGQAAAKEGVPWLRLDCSKDNQSLQSYYLNQGFQHLDTFDLPHRLSGALFQRHSQLLPEIKAVSNGRFTVSLLAGRQTSQHSSYSSCKAPWLPSLTKVTVKAAPLRPGATPGYALGGPPGARRASTRRHRLISPVIGNAPRDRLLARCLDSPALRAVVAAVG